MRIGIVGQGDGRSPLTWSGIPHGLGRALEGAGHEVVHVDANPPPRVRRPVVGTLRLLGVRGTGAPHGPELAALRSRWVAHQARRVDPDLWLQLNTGVVLPAGARRVTLHDLTLPQALQVGWSDAARMSASRAAAWRRREAEICRSADACCTASDWTAASLREDHGIAAERVHVVGFGTNVVPRPPAMRDWTIPRYLFVGREWERKAGPAVLAAFAAVRAHHPSATLTIVGTHPRVEAAGVRDLGALSAASPADRETLAGLFAAATCFVLPSLMEPFGIAYLEAGAAGVPSIGTTRGGAATAVGPGGLLVDPGDHRALVTAMLDLADAGRARELGVRAAEHAAKHTWAQVAARMLAVL